MTAALAGVALPLAAWLLLRGGRGGSRWLALDAAPALTLGLGLLAITARPLLSGALVAALLLGLLAVERAKRAALGEGLVFTDYALLPMVARHPSLYLPFLPRGLLPAAVIGGALALVAMLSLESTRAVPRLMLLGAACVLLLLLRRADLLASPSGDPDTDAARFGPLATLALHRAVAARERPARQAALLPTPTPLSGVAPHLVLVQCESFCDPRRCAGIAAALPQWDRLGGEALLRGTLEVPGFGANTMRTEFAVLSGAPPAALGLDRFNPYARFARRPVHSLAHALEGHGALALHPFDRRFFGRHLVLPALGFTRFDAAEAFAGAPRAGAHVADAALGARIIAELRAAAAPTFLFAITMQAHGPWTGEDGQAQWLGHIADTDRMLGAIAAAAADLELPLVLVAYGDHRPALAALRDGQDTDYLIWRSDRAGHGTPHALDAHQLHAAILAAVAGEAG
ncbi:MAG: LTA synthase family protein [Pseudomonadota bacterium]